LLLDEVVATSKYQLQYWMLHLANPATQNMKHILQIAEAPDMKAPSRRLSRLTWNTCLFLSTVSADAAANPTIIDQLPYRMTSPGAHHFADDLHSDQGHGAAIVVEADDVTIDLKDNTLSGTAISDTLAIGIQGNGRSNVAIISGRIAGFYFEIDLRAPAASPACSPVISDLVLSRNQYFGMRIVGADSDVRRSTIMDTGGSTRPGHTIPHGVRLVGARNVMRDCKFIDLRLKRFDDGSGEIVAVHFDAAKDSVFEHNLVIELPPRKDAPIPPDDTKERAFGIWINGGPKNDTFVTVRDYTFIGFTVPVVFSPGSDGQATDNTFYDANPKPVRKKPAT